MSHETVTVVMGQCQGCRKSSSAAEAMEDELRNPSVNDAGLGCSNENRQLQRPELCVVHTTGSDSALDSGHSSDHCCDEGDVCSQHSSESSEKYSLRGSTGSCCGNIDKERAVQPSPSFLQVLDIPVQFESNEDISRPESVIWDGLDALTPFHAHQIGSHGSSITSVNSMAYNINNLFRSKSLRVDHEVPFSSSVASSRASSPLPGTDGKQSRPKRSISLKIPRRTKRSRKESTLNLPTIYANDKPIDFRKQSISAPSSPKDGTIRRALSLLSMNSLLNHHQHGEGTVSPHSPSGSKASSSILRQPRRRHNTVRGMSGMAIDSANQPGYHQQGRPVSPMFYYPTPTSLRQTQSLRQSKAKQSYDLKKEYSDAEYFLVNYS